jgi:sec-independent protein translocase protein TatA
MPNLGPTELMIVLVLVIIVFGVGKLPEVGGALGKSIKEFKKSSVDPEETARKEETARLEAERSARDAEVQHEVERRLAAEREASKETARKE